MRVTRIAAVSFLLLGCGIAGWFSTLHAIPYLASDVIFRVLENRGIKHNQLTPSLLSTAGEDPVPMTNADMVTRSAVYDLSDGPVLFEANVPTSLHYWSVTVFGHNSDVLSVTNDRQAGPGPFRLGIRKADQTTIPQADVEVVSPSERGFLLVRAITSDRNSAADVAASRAALADEKITQSRVKGGNR
jgi:uncharacterized membrane protein